MGAASPQRDEGMQVPRETPADKAGASGSGSASLGTRRAPIGCHREGPQVGAAKRGGRTPTVRSALHTDQQLVAERIKTLDQTYPHLSDPLGTPGDEPCLRIPGVHTHPPEWEPADPAALTRLGRVRGVGRSRSTSARAGRPSNSGKTSDL